MQVQAFRTGRTNILVVTDVAARGIDIPILANVINYDFPSQSKIFVHRVGRTARAGQKGWSYSIVHDADAPYLLDLQLFLSRQLIVGRHATQSPNFAEEIIVGSLQRDNMQNCCEWVTRTLEEDADIGPLRSVAMKGEKLYQRTRNSASTQSAKRAKEIVASAQWSELHPLFASEKNDLEAEREKMLARIGGFRPEESIFEIGARRGGRRNNEEAVDAIRKIRSGLETKKQKSSSKNRSNKLGDSAETQATEGQVHVMDDDEENKPVKQDLEMLDLSEASDSEIEVTFSNHKQLKRHRLRGYMPDEQDPMSSFRDTENFMSYTPSTMNLSEDHAYGVHSGSNVKAAGHQSASFAEASRNATMDLAGDETGGKTFGETHQVMRWDKRHKKYVRRSNDEDGSKGGNKLVRGESGAKIAASFKSGRYDAWRKANRIARVPRVGEVESPAATQPRPNGGLGGRGKRFKHNRIQTAKAPDKFRDDYEKKSKKLREEREKARDMGEANGGGRNSVSSGGKGSKNGKITNSVDDIRKQRQLKEKRKEKNARPSRKGKR